MENQQASQNQTQGTHVVQSATAQNEKASGADNQQAQPKKPEKKPFWKSYDIALFSFVFMAVVVLLLIVMIEVQRQAYMTLAGQREGLVTSEPGDTNVTQEQVSQIEEAFLTQDGVIDFIDTVEQARFSFETFDIRFVSDVPEGRRRPQYLPVAISIEGPYENIQAFLDALHTSPYVIQITNMELVSEDGFEGSAALNLSARLYVSDTYSSNGSR